MAAVGRITRQLSDERASLLAQEAIVLSNSGQIEEASRKLREAAALGHDNVDVQAAFLALHQGQSSSPLIDLCRRYAQYHDPRAGVDAAIFLRSPDSANLGSAALECLKIILDESSSKLDVSQDVIVAELARHSLAVRQYIALQLADSTTSFFEDIYDRGDEAANCMRNVVLEPKLWHDEAVRFRVEDDLFQLFIAKLMESGHDHDGRALKGITLLLLADTQRLYSFIDEDAFDALLTSLDYRLPADVRGQATLVISKFMEISELEAQKFFTNFVTTHIARQTGDDLIMAFSAAAQLFPVASNIIAQLFLTQGFLPGIMPLLQHKFSSPLVHDAFLALLNAACIDGACRNAINQTCAAWLSHKVSNGTSKQPALAANILAKLRTAGLKGTDQKANKADDDVSELVDLFEKNLNVEEGSNVSDSIEGLAYTTLKPEVKEKLAKNQSSLKALLHAVETHPTNPEIVVGGLSVISNLSHFQPNLSEEQKKMSQLKAYANASKPAESSPLEDDAHVEARCAELIKAGVTPTLVGISKSPSSATTQLTDKILLSLSRSKKDRGLIAQQGAVKLLISHAQNPTSQPSLHALERTKSERSVPSTPSPDAAHALARILISLNPSHIFQGNAPHITNAVPPLVSLLKPANTTESHPFSDQPRDLLPIFESLLALTNLASSPDQDAANSIIRQGWDTIEDLMLTTNNDMVRRAAVELICNLVAYPQGVGKFADGSRRARERLRLMIAMADVEDEKTRSASGGALAMLTDYDVVLKSIIEDEKFNRTVEVFLDMFEDKDIGLKHRSFAVLLNLLEAEKELGDKAKTTVIEQGGVEKVKTALKEVREPTVLQLGVNVLKKLMDSQQ